MPSARFSDCVSPSAQNQLRFSHCLCPPTAEDEDPEGFPTLLSHQTPPGTTLPLSRLQCQGESFLPRKTTAQGRSTGAKRYHRADTVWDLLINPYTSDKPVQGIRKTPELSHYWFSQELLRASTAQAWNKAQHYRPSPPQPRLPTRDADPALKSERVPQDQPRDLRSHLI